MVAHATVRFRGEVVFSCRSSVTTLKLTTKPCWKRESGRVDTDDVAESLILAKPSDADMHEGGKRFDVDSWQYRVLSRWIEAGAKHDDTEPQVLEQLEILPREVQFSSADQSVSLTAIAHWQDGTREDVTELCRFSSNDDSIAMIDETGKLNCRRNR